MNEGFPEGREASAVRVVDVVHGMFLWQLLVGYVVAVVVVVVDSFVRALQILFVAADFSVVVLVAVGVDFAVFSVLAIVFLFLAFILLLVFLV